MINFLKRISMGFSTLEEGFYNIANAFNSDKYDYDDVKRKYKKLKGHLRNRHKND